MLSRLKYAALLIAVLLMTSAAQAQTGLSYGSTASGTISAAGSTVSFSFSGAAGDLIFARVIPISSGLQLASELIAPDGSTAASGSDGVLTERLSASGGYLLKVTGQSGTGDFVARLDAQIGISTALTLGQVTRAVFEVDAPPEPFHFQQNPNAQTLLTVSAADPAFRFSTAVRDSSGRLIAFFNAETRSAVLTVAPGDGAYDVTISAADPSLAGLVLIDLEAGDAGAAPVTTTPTIPPIPIPLALTATALPSAAGSAALYCQISSNGTANIRSAPNASADVLDRLTRSRAVQVVGISADGAWYAVRLSSGIGWVAQSVAREVTPCLDVPVVSP